MAKKVMMDKTVTRKNDRFDEITGNGFISLPFGKELEAMDRLKQEELYDMLHNQKIKLLGELVNGFTHQLNNLLVGVVGFADLLLNKIDKNDKNYHYIEVIKSAGEDCQEAVSQLFRFSKRQQFVAFTQVNIRELLDSSLMMVSKHPKFKKVRIDKSYTGDYPTLGDSIPLEQAFINMLVNSIQGMENDVGILVECSVDKNGYTVVAITGNCKKTKEETPAATASAPIVNGYGMDMSLPIAHWIIKAHGGRLSTESSSEKGIVLKAFIPVRS